MVTDRTRRLAKYWASARRLGGWRLALTAFGGFIVPVITLPMGVILVVAGLGGRARRPSWVVVGVALGFFATLHLLVETPLALRVG